MAKIMRMMGNGDIAIFKICSLSQVTLTLLSFNDIEFICNVIISLL